MAAKTPVTDAERHEFLQGYITCMLWSTTDNSNESGGEPLDANYNDDDIAEVAMKQIREDCNDFIGAQTDDIRAATAKQRDYTWARAGHDFWLTRNGHGAGFWDRGLGYVGERLSSAARVYSSCDPYIGDDGRIYI